MAYVRKTSDAAVKEKTGKTWKGWFSTLDAAGAKKLDHRSIAKHLKSEHGIPGWWCQKITVEYELERGLRNAHQAKDGFEVTVSKTMAAEPSALYRATIDATARKRWFPRGDFLVTSKTAGKSVRGKWNAVARIEVGFYAKPGGKALVALAVKKLAKAADVERQRKLWKGALATLEKNVAKEVTSPRAGAADRASRTRSGSRASRRNSR